MAEAGQHNWLPCFGYFTLHSAIRKEARFVNMREEQSNLEYWLSKTPIERLSAVETLRKRYELLIGPQPGLQRVYRVVKKASRG